MVFSRYVAVLRGAGKLLQPNVLDAKVSNDRTFAKTASILRAANVEEQAQSEQSSFAEKTVPTSSNSDDDSRADVAPRVYSFTSKPATSFGSKTIARRRGWHSLDKEVAVSERRHPMEHDALSESDIVLLKNYESLEAKGPLDTCEEDLSHIAPYHLPTFNFAAYADKSPTIQELAKLGVKFYKLEAKPEKMKCILGKNFDDMKPYIRFLNDTGVPANRIGHFITKNPFIFDVDMDDLHTRIRYMRAHKFTIENISRIVTENPNWLQFSTTKIDTRLGFFQREFSLNGSSVRFLATKQPKLITYDINIVRDNIFGVREEMGFDTNEMKSILLMKPNLFMQSRKIIVQVFDYAHNTMKLPHDLICRQPHVLTCRFHRLQTRHRYLETLGRNQYDPTKPLYVSPQAIVSGSDVEFCLNVAGTSVETYNIFQKTL